MDLGSCSVLYGYDTPGNHADYGNQRSQDQTKAKETGNKLLRYVLNLQALDNL
jgi:hypothetical protein